MQTDFQHVAISLSQSALTHLFAAEDMIQLVANWLQFYSCIKTMWLSTCVILQLNCHHAAIKWLLVEEFLNLSFKFLRFWLDCDVILCYLLLFAILSQIALNCQLDPTELWTDIRPTKVTTIQKATGNRWHMVTRVLVMPWSPTTVFHGVTEDSFLLLSVQPLYIGSAVV